MSTTNQQFTNPYDSLPPDRLYRTSILLDRLIYAELFRMNSRRGVLQTTVSVLLHKLIERLGAAGFEGYDPDRFEEAVANCTINLGGQGNGQPTAEPTKPKRAKRATSASS